MLFNLAKQVQAFSKARVAQLCSPKVVHWAKVLSKFVSVQIVVQVLGALTGILIVRTLEPAQYAYFMIANTMQATLNLLADTGVSSGLSSIGGQIWQDHSRLSQLIATGLRLRKKLARYSAIVVTPILLWLLLKNKAEVGLALVLVLLVLIEINFRLVTSVYQMILRLRSEIRHLQNLDILFAFSRLVLVGIATLTYLNTTIALLSSTIASGLQRVLIGRWASRNFDTDAPQNEGDKREILALVKAQAPNTIYYCIQGQIAIWLISIFGNVKNIAEVGALSRLMIILTLGGSVLTNIVIPSYARCQIRAQLIRRYWQILSIYGLFSACIIGLIVVFPNQLLWILGEQYGNLQQELILMAASVVISSFAGLLWHINVAKGWIKLAWLSVPVTIFTQILLLFVVDVSTVKGVILFGMLSVIPASFLNFYMTHVGLKETLQPNPQ